MAGMVGRRPNVSGHRKDLLEAAIKASETAVLAGERELLDATCSVRPADSAGGNVAAFS
jgi:hypothetical protein